jgi:hypothetical protein
MESSVKNYTSVWDNSSHSRNTYNSSPSTFKIDGYAGRVLDITYDTSISLERDLSVSPSINSHIK